MRSFRRAMPRLAILLTSSIIVLRPVPAQATVACASVATNVNITLASGDAVTVTRDPSGTFSVSGTGLTATSCGGATVSNRDTVNITGAGGNESVTIDLTEGEFAPGGDRRARHHR